MKTIDVVVICYPDGSTVHLREADRKEIEKANKGWRDSLTPDERSRYEEAGITGGGAVVIRMIESDYEAMWSSNHPALVALCK